MKFTQLPIGARFEFEGKVYVKIGPIAASTEQGGQRMIPRWADLRPLDGPASVAEPKPPRVLDEAVVLAAYESFWRECGRVLDEAVEDDARLANARRQLAVGRERYLATLGHADGPGACRAEEA